MSATSITASVPSLSELFTGTAGAFRRLPSRSTAAWMALGAAATLSARAADVRVNSALGSNNHHEAFEAGSAIGAIQFQIGASLATYAVGRIVHSPRAASLGADLFQAQVLSQAVTQAAKMAARRTRPDGTTLSFPSGHTSAAFASATVLQKHLGWKAGIPAYALATYVAASRIEEKRHFLSDVTFGAVIGIVAGRTVTVGRGDARFAVSPVATAGGGAVAFTWVGQR